MADVLALAAAKLESGDAFHALGFTPHPGPQTEFLAVFDEPNTDTLYGGAAGGGKSQALLMGALRSAQRHPGLQAFWFRRTFPELEHSVLRLLARYRYARDLGATWNASRYELRLPNGSTLTFAHAKNLAEATALQSGEIQLLILDERTTMPPDVVDMLYTRVRSGVPGLPCLGIRSATNPGGIGHSRALAEFITATGHGERAYTDASGRLRRFIQARVSDNPSLGPEYAASLAGLPEGLRRAFLDGDWQSFAGQMFAEWRYDRHVVDPVSLPETWARYSGHDYGYAAPFAVVWAAEDNDGRLWVYRDHEASQVVEREQARRILAAEGDGEVVTIRAADPSMWAKKGEADAPADLYAAEGVHLVPANNDRVNGWHRIHSYLADAPACDAHRAAGWDTCPRLHVFRTCANVIRSLPALPYATTGNPEDADTHGDDHTPDALRYLCVAAGGTPLAEAFVFAGPPQVHPADLHPMLPAPPGWRPDTDWREVVRPWGS